MSRAFLHSGLALILAIAPTLCCCQAAWLAKPAAHTHTAPVPNSAAPAPPSCCHKVPKSCCDRHADPAPAKRTAPTPQHAPECACCADRQPGAPHESDSFQSVPQPTGELLSLELAGLVGSPEHAACVAVLSHGPPGGDVKYAKLFERHVLRC